MTTARLRHLATAAATALLLAACGDEKQDIFTPEGDRARSINDLQLLVFGVAGGVGVLVAIAMIVAIVKGRRAFKDDNDDPVQLEGNFKLEIAWTIAPALLLGFIALLTVGTLLRLDDNDASASELDGLEITVYGQQWWWSYEYEVGDGDDDVDIITANDLVIPAGVPITLNIESRDVIHSFWVPSLNGTVDAAPGRSHSLVIEADEPGEFYGQCKEYCGLSHANMKLRVVALSEADFATWKDQQQQEQEMLAEGDFGFEGQAIFLSLCSTCHQINGLEDAEGQPLIVDASDNLVSGVAPNLTHLMSREVFAGAMFELYDEETGEFNRGALEAWIRNPPAEKPMYTDVAEGELPRGMPDLGLTEEQIDQLVDYLTTLGPQPPSPTAPTPVPPTETTDEAGS